MKKRRNKQSNTSGLIIGVIAVCLLVCWSMRGRFTALTVEGAKVDRAEYAFYLNYNRLRLFGAQSEYSAAQLEQAAAESIEQIAAAETVRNMCRELGIELSDSQRDELKQHKALLIEQLGGKGAFKQELKTSCLTSRTYDKLQQNDLYYNLLREYYTERSGSKYTEEYLRSYYSGSYILLKYIRLSLYDSNGDRITQKEEEKQYQLAAKILEKVQNGEDFDQLIFDYSDDKSVAGGSEGIIISRQDSRAQSYMQAAFELTDGGTSGIVEQADGLYIVKRTKAPEEFFAPNTDSIKNTAAEEDFAAMLDEWTAQATVEKKKSADRINFQNLKNFVR